MASPGRVAGAAAIQVMLHRRHPDDVRVRPDDLWDLAWSAPMRQLAARVGMSDVGLRKLLRSYGVPIPPQGHWNRVHAGRVVTARPAVPPRRPGATGLLRVDRRLGALLESAGPMPAEGPFASALVPEDLDELLARERTAIGRATVPRTLAHPAPGLREVLARDERRRVKFAAEPYSFNAPEFDTPFARRRLRILNALFLTLARRGHSGRAYVHDGELHASAVVGETGVGLELAPAGRHRTALDRGRQRPAPDLPASTPLALTIDPGFDQQDRASWMDGGGGALEERIGEIAAAIVAAGERALRRGLRAEEAWREQAQLAVEAARRERLAARDRRRLEDLHASGELLRQAEDLRALVTRVKQAALAGNDALDADAVRAWEAWALAEADRLDPVRSGQILTHLLPPTDD